MAHPERCRQYPATSEPGRRLFEAGNPMAGNDDRHEHEEDPLETTELARRLRRMKWPPAPPEVKARVLERIVERVDEELGRSSDGRSSESADADG